MRHASAPAARTIHLIAEQRMRGRYTAFGAAQTHCGGLEVHIALQAAKLARSQTLPEGNQKHCGIPLPQRFRFAASISLSISRSVRCSRSRSSPLGRRSGATVRFSVAGGTSFSAELVM